LVWKATIDLGLLYTEKRLNALLVRLDEKITAYLATLDQGEQDAQEVSPEDEALAEKLHALQTRHQTYQDLLEELQASEETQLSCTDADTLAC
jgi:prefoldin subunit 5